MLEGILYGHFCLYSPPCYLCFMYRTGNLGLGQAIKLFLPLPTVFITDKISSFCLQVALQILYHKLPQHCAHLCDAIIDYLSSRNSSADGRYGRLQE